MHCIAHNKLRLHIGLNNSNGDHVMRLWEFAGDKWGVYGKPPKRTKTDGTQSPLTFQGDAKWQNDKDFAHKWFSRPFLTNGPRGNYMLPVKKQKD
jgi:hypothetical protein